MSAIPAMQEVEVKDSSLRPALRPYLKNKLKPKGPEAEHLPSKCRALNSILNAAKNRQKIPRRL
jgi:hypothetical protein